MNDHEWLEVRFAEVRPKAIATLTRQFQVIELAEDAFATSCEKALKVWPVSGMPRDPLAWLITVARNSLKDQLRRHALHIETAYDSVAPAVLDQAEQIASQDSQINDEELRDDVLRLLFICCHPALSFQDQAAIALRIVTGMRVDEIARAFLVKTKTMERRITRAKQTISKANTAFESPSLQERHQRLEAVSLMIYLLFNEGWLASTGNSHLKLPLCDEAIRLARLLLDLFSGISELMGLLALFLFQHSRRNARIDSTGAMVPLDKQNRDLWDQQLIAEANALLEKALRHATPGRYQIQAAIAAVHSASSIKQPTDWLELDRLYEALYLFDPSPIVKLNHAAVVAKIDGPAAALSRLDPLAVSLTNYRWYHSARGEFLLQLKRYNDAREAFEDALSLNPTDVESHSLQSKIEMCRNG